MLGVARGFSLMTVRTSSASEGTVQENSGELSLYHFAWSGCVSEVTVTEDTPVLGETTGTLSLFVGVEAESRTVIVAPREPVKISVPWPSLAKTEAEENESEAVPPDLPRSEMVTILPAAPVKPGLRTTPSKETVPSAFEKDGSCTQSVATEPDFETETTSNLSVGKATIPDAAFMAWSSLPTTTFTKTISPCANEREDGDNERVAAKTPEGRARPAKKEKRKRNIRTFI